MTQLSFLDVTGSNRIAYHFTPGRHSRLPGIVFLGGFMSDMGGTKAIALQDYCETQGYTYVRFDYFGHGQSSLKFTDGTIGAWKQNVLDVLDHLTKGPQILVGSSMGGWLMLLAALERKDRIAGLVGIASAPDFTKDLIWDLLAPDIQHRLKTEGVYSLESEYGESPYPITYHLIEEGNRHLVLHKPLPIRCPVRLLHGMQDKDVPYTLSSHLLEQLESEDAQLLIIKNADHRMSTPENIRLLCAKIEEMLAICGKKD